MIGVGLVLCFVSTVMYTVMTGVKLFSEQSHNITMPDTPQVPLYWILSIEYLNGIGSALTMTFGTELVMAQTPNRMRGIMMGLVIAMVGWTRHGGNYTITRGFHTCQAIQAEKEGEARQHTGHSGGTLRKILRPGGGVHERNSCDAGWQLLI